MAGEYNKGVITENLDTLKDIFNIEESDNDSAFKQILPKLQQIARNYTWNENGQLKSGSMIPTFRTVGVIDQNKQTELLNLLPTLITKKAGKRRRTKTPRYTQ